MIHYFRIILHRDHIIFQIISNKTTAATNLTKTMTKSNKSC